MMHLIFVQMLPLGPILENKGMDATFSEKGQRNVEKGENTWKFGQKMYKIRRYSEKGQVHAIIARNKLLE